MNELASLIIGSVETLLLEVPDIGRWDVPIQGSKIEEVSRSLMEKRIRYIGDRHKPTGRAIWEKREDYAKRDDTFLAAGLIEHNVSNIWQAIKSACEYHEGFKDKKSLSGAIANLTKYRSFLMTMCYLVSDGNKRFLEKIPEYHN